MKLSITKYDMWMYFEGNELNDRYSNITELTIEGLKKTESGFLSQNTTLKKISLPDVVEVKYSFLENNEVLEDIYLPKVKTIGFSFLSENSALKKIVLPNVQKIESWFLRKNNQIRSISFPELRVIGESFMYENEVLEEVILPNVTEIGDHFLWTNRALKKLFVPKLEKKGSNFSALNSMYQKIESEEDFNNEVNTNLCPNCGSVLDEDNWCDECCEFYDIEDKESKDSYDDVSDVASINLCSKCCGILDEDNWCADCLDFVEPKKDGFSKTLEWLLEDEIEKTNTLKTKKVDSIYNLEYQYNSTNKSINLYEIPYEELFERSEKYELPKYGGIKPIFFEFYDNEYMYDGDLFIKSVDKKELVNGKKVLRLSDSFIWNDEKKNELKCIEESLEINKYKIRNMINKCPICGEFEYTPEDQFCEVCGWFFSSIFDKYKDYKDYHNNVSFNEYKNWWKGKRKIDPNFIFSDDMNSYPVESAEIKTKKYKNWEYSLMKGTEVIIYEYHGDDKTDKNVQVPSEIEGKRVVGISGFTFNGSVNSIVFPNTLRFIDSLVIGSINIPVDLKVFIPNSVEYIAKEAFKFDLLGFEFDLTLYIEFNQIPNSWDKEFDICGNNGERCTVILGAKKENVL